MRTHTRALHSYIHKLRYIPRCWYTCTYLHYVTYLDVGTTAITTSRHIPIPTHFQLGGLANQRTNKHHACGNTLYVYIYIHTYVKHTHAHTLHYITYIRTYKYNYAIYLDVATTSRTSSESFSACSKREKSTTGQQSHNRVNGASYDKEASHQQPKPPLAVTARGQSAPATDQLEE